MGGTPRPTDLFPSLSQVGSRSPTAKPEASSTERASEGAQLPDDGYRKGFDSHTEGWGRELGELVAYLDAA